VKPKLAVSLVFVAATFISIMDSTVVQVALPTLARTFRTNEAAASAVVTSYLVTLAVIMPATAWLADRFGAKRTLLAALALFTAASALCGAAADLPQLVGFRALQGIAGGALLPVGTTLLYRTFPQQERIRATRTLMVPALLAPAIGPVLGGVLVDGLSWRWIFYVNVPIGIAAVAFGVLALPADRDHEAAVRFDLPGFLLAGSGFPLLTYALSEGADDGWTSPLITATGLSGLALLAAFIFTERRVADPLLHIDLLKDRMFRVANLQSVFATAGFLGVLFLVPLFLQDGLGYSAVHSGLTTFPEAVGGMTGIQFSGRIYNRTGPRALMISGSLLTVVAIGSMALIGTGVVHWLLPVLMFATGMGIGIAMAPAQTAALSAISRAGTAQATTLYNTQRQAGAAAGVALLATVLAASHGHYHWAFAVAAGLMVIATAIASLVRNADAVATMTPRPASTRLAEGLRAQG
jgi:EmrB/QacA subfamily drug resistance transporter